MSGGGSSGSGNSYFQRTGTASTSSWRELTGEQQDLFRTSLGAVSPGAANAGVDNLLRSRMSASPQSAPYVEELCRIINANLPNLPFAGGSNLEGMASRDPYGTSYENNTFQRYAQEVGRAMAQARSGPAMVQGGAASRGFAEAEMANNLALNREDVLARNRTADAGVAQQAAQLHAGINSDRARTALGGIGADQQGFFQLLGNQLAAGSLASERVKMHNDLVPTFASLASTLNGRESNNLSGWGAQTSSSMGMGVNLCCFIFLEAYNGKLPWYVRKYRDLHAPESSARRKGYVKMSKWLVPAMRVSGFARRLTNYLLIKPLTSYGRWALADGKVGWVFWPVKWFWFKLWERSGNNKNEKR